MVRKNLGLRGGYSRRIRSNLPSSIANSQYIVSDDVGLRVVALSGKKTCKTPVHKRTTLFTSLRKQKDKNTNTKTVNKKRISKRKKKIFARLEL